MITQFKKGGILYALCNFCPVSAEKYCSTTKHDFSNKGVLQHSCFNGQEWALENDYRVKEAITGERYKIKITIKYKDEVLEDHEYWYRFACCRNPHRIKPHQMPMGWYKQFRTYSEAKEWPKKATYAEITGS